MKRTLARVAGLVGAVACTTALTAPLTAAHAETQSHDDARNDVSTAQLTRLAGGPKALDIVSTTNTYKGGDLTLTIEVADLAKDNYGAFWMVKTPGQTYFLSAYRFNGMDSVSFYEGLRQAPGQTRGEAGGCEGVKVKRAAKKDSLVGTVPRSCLGGADTVRVAAQMQREGRSGYSIDDARRKGYDFREDTPKLGPALDHN